MFFNFKSEFSHRLTIILDKDCYDTRVNRQKCRETVSDTLMKRLGKLSPNLDRALPALLIVLQKYGFTCIYDEVRHFKHSAAKAITMEPSLPGLSTSSSRLIQVIVDNFDTDISSPRKSSTHSFAMLLTQPNSNSSEAV